MILTLMLKESIISQFLPERIQGQYWVKLPDSENHINQILSVEAAGDSWIVKSTKDAYICNRDGAAIRECALQALCFYKIKITLTNEYALLYCENATVDRKTYTKLILPSKGTIRIGRDEHNDIVFSNAFVSSVHSEITFSGNNIIIRDNSSSNGTFVNEKRITEARLRPGDVIFIMGLKIIIGKGYISFNNPDKRVHISSNELLAFQQQEIIQRTPAIESDDNTVKFFRSPRFKRDIKTFELTIDPPPASAISEQMPLLLTIGPSATMAIASLATATTTVINLCSGKSDILSAMPMLVMAFAMLCGTLVWPNLIKKYENNKKQKKEDLRQEKYKTYINSIKDELNNECSYQSEILNENFVSLDVCLSRIKLIQRNLWERTSSHNDFLTLRLGKGTALLDCDIKCQKRKFTLEEDSLQEMQFKLAEQPQMLRNVPKTLSLIDDSIVGIIGEKSLTTAFAKSLLFQLVALHCYDEVKVVIICSEADKTWDFAKWLPHIWNDEHTVRFMAQNSQEVKELSIHLEREIAARSNLREYDATVTPQYVVLALDQTIAERADFMKLIYKNKNYIGFSVIAAYDELKNLPKECNRIIEISQQRSRIYDRDDISGKFDEFSPELFLGGGEEEYAIALANITLDTAAEEYILPSTITFTETYDVGRIEYLNILSRWKENDPTTSLSAVIGVDEYGEKFSFDIHEKAHGPHGLIAGTTGSGKSEFIMTYILSMAVNYHPSEVAFILIDYKGGGMAKAFETLPHTAGIITNLDGSEVNRSLVSIKSELRRRQSIFNSASKKVGMSNIDIYKYQRLHREGVVSEPLPHLIIISDEFAELKAQQPDFMAELISTARIGRSLGVHLVLATQKPTGVVDDQIVSNTRFRICLKVQDRQDSMEMLKRPEAAELTKTGRFYLQVGNNEIFKLGQSAWSGAKYIPSDRVNQQLDNSISIVANTGKILKQIRLKGNGSSESISQLDAVTKYISELAKQEHFRQRMLWCPSMPAVSTVETIRNKYAISGTDDVEPVLGEYDVPELQKQEALTLPFSRIGNTVIYGSSGSGKTTFVTTLMYSLITQYSPDLVNIYALDFSAQTLSIFSGVAHVGDIIMPEESEKVENLFKLLHSELKKRKTLLQEYGGDFTSYKKMSGDSMPCIVVIIHNYTGLIESYDVEDSIAFFSREGAKRGIYFVVTAQSANAIRHKTLQNFGQTLVLRMNDPLDYSSILGNTGGLIPANHLGRGIFKSGNIYEFQIAKCTTDNEVQHVRELCRTVNDNWKGKTAPGIPVLPEKVDSVFLHNALSRCSEEMLPIGVDREKLTVVNYPILGSSLTWVLSDSGNNSLFAQGLAELACLKNDVMVTVIDPTDKFMPDITRKYSYFSGNEDVNSATAHIFDEMLRRHNLLKTDSNSTFEKLLCIITSVSSLDGVLTEENRENFFDALNNVSQKYGIYFAICESSSYFNSNSNKEWVRSHTTFKDTIWLGNGLLNNFRLQIDKAPKNAREPLEDPYGFAVVNGTAVIAKLLVPQSWEPEEDQYE